jgi:photosystem II stability/assembly factor-like uncharacterized protein
MKKIVLLLSLPFIIVSGVYPQNFWQKIDSPTTKNLNTVVFINSLEGWAGGNSGLIIHTTDGGISWDEQFTNDSITISNIFFLNNQIGWASAISLFFEPYGTFLLRTDNGGITWSKEYMRIGQANIKSLYFHNITTGLAVGIQSVFIRTTDGGSTWIPVNLDSSTFAGFTPYKLRFLNDQIGYACGGAADVAGVIWKTTDGGLNWKTVVDTGSITYEPIFDLHIFDSLSVIVVGGDQENGTNQGLTTDGGQTWQYKRLTSLYFPLSIGFRTNSEGWAPLYGTQILLYTSDSGKSWVQLPTPDSTFITSICFPDSLHGYGVGINGSMIRYKYEAPNRVNSGKDRIKSFHLSQNYPNPFNPSTKIYYYIPAAGIVKLNIYDVLGREIINLVNEYKAEGSYTIDFNAWDLPSGVYFYKLQVGNNMKIRKMILLR